MDGMIITEEAVAAAVRAWSERAAQPGSWTIEESARTALEAAAPHIESAMIEDGWREPDEACCCGMCGL